MSNWNLTSHIHPAACELQNQPSGAALAQVLSRYHWAPVSQPHMQRSPVCEPLPGTVSLRAGDISPEWRSWRFPLGWLMAVLVLHKHSEEQELILKGKYISWAVKCFNINWAGLGYFCFRNSCILHSSLQTTGLILLLILCVPCVWRLQPASLCKKAEWISRE